VGVGRQAVSGPHVSVIIPTRNRASSLRALLASLAAQTYADREVLVVDDGASAETRDIVDAFPSVRYIAGDGSGAVGARCLGVKEARGDVLAFTDDDCVADADWLAAGVAAIDGGADVVQGRTVPQREPAPLERTVAHEPADGFFPTCNVFYRRSAYERAGGFDREVGRRLGFRGDPRSRALGFGADVVLGWVVARSGTAAAVPEAIVRHDVVRPRLRELIYREWAAGGFPSLLREIPELRRTVIRKRIVLGRPDARLGAYGLLLLAIPGVQLVGLVVTAAWVAARVRRLAARRAPFATKVVALPVELLQDATKSLALVLGSAQARTLVI
jgi:glycosyltransferase involved in cell wall biosynthesis